MRTIHKYRINDIDVIAIPKGAKVLHAGIQSSAMTIWAEVDTEEKELEKRQFMIFGTGHTMPNNGRLNHISSVQDDVFVWHVYEWQP